MNTLRLHLLRLLLLDLEQKRSVDMWQNTTERDGRADQRIQFLVSADGELQVARSDTLDLEILGCVSCQFQDFGREVFEDGGDVYGGFGTDAHLVLGLRLQETLDTTAGEL